MTYRDDILAYVDACLDSLEVTVKGPRAKELYISDIENIISRLRLVSQAADLALAEARQEGRKA